MTESGPSPQCDAVIPVMEVNEATPYFVMGERN